MQKAFWTFYNTQKKDVTFNYLFADFEPCIVKFFVTRFYNEYKLIYTPQWDYNSWIEIGSAHKLKLNISMITFARV